MKTTTYKCDNNHCDKEHEGGEPSGWLIIDGGEFGLSLKNGLKGARVTSLDNYGAIHFCSRGCFFDFLFFYEEKATQDSPTEL